MNKFKSLGRMLSKEEQKKIKGGDGEVGGLGGDYDCGSGDTYCGSGSGVTCCTGYTCQDAGNASDPYVKGGDKICA